MENKARSPDSEPIYYEISPKIVIALRTLFVVTLLMVVLAFIFTLVQATHNHAFYMLTCNIIFTSMVGLTNVYWYWKGQLAPDKHWYMMLVGLVIIWQCIATDIYVFHGPRHSQVVNVTTITTAPTTHVTMITV